MGPTASGKTDLAVELVRRLPCSIISVDSALVYREMDIGTAKPGPELLAEAPHRLIDILDPAESYSASRFRSDALREMEAIRASGRIPLLVGGTMLYFRALAAGLSDLPAADPAVRARLEAELADGGLAALHARLARVDPESGRRIHPNDPQRIQRALEVWELTGRPLSALWAEHAATKPGMEAVLIALAPARRAVLHERIERRFHAMLAAGFVDEVERLRRRGDLHPGLPSMRSVGYRQVWSYLEGQIGHGEMVERGIAATRQLAKRQITWLRGWPGVNWVDSLGSNPLDEVLKNLTGSTI